MSKVSEIDVSYSGSSQTLDIWQGVIRWMVLLLILVISWAVVHAFKIEDQLGLVQLFPLVIIGFGIHSHVPTKWRLKSFLLITAGAASYLFGLINTVWLTAVVIGFVWMASTDISHRIKVWSVMVAAIILGLMKSGLLPGPVPSNMITVAASMLMFRMIIYLYDIRHEKEEVGFWRRLAYFFMLPNLVFPIFPIVDYKVFKKTYFNAPPYEIYERGVLMIVRGVLHLMIYRVVYLFFIPPVDEILGLFDLTQYLVMSYVTILRLSGMLHIAVGVLLLFGFNLPEIFNNFFLASGFSDYWRRINIYWKDFVLKIFYYPIYFKVKNWGPLTAIVVTTMIVFFFNWLLHVYQWFWILGRIYVRSTDIAFWTIFGVLVTFSAVFQQQSNRHVNVKSLNYGLVQTAKILMTFTLASLLWSIWTSPSFSSWFGIMSVATQAGLRDWALLVVIVLAIILAGGMIHVWYYNRIKGSRSEKVILSLNLPVMTAILVVLLLMSSVRGQRYMESKFDVSVKSVMTMSLNETDQAAQFQGYYEEILTANNLSSPLWQKKDPDFEERIQDNEIIIKSGDILVNLMRPSSSSEFKNKQVTSNQFGMRDRDYTQLPPEGVTRFALLGGSIEMGSGVGDEEVFENITERKLNADSTLTRESYEILNFSMSARNLIQHLYQLEHQVIDFQPDYLIIVNHDREWNAIANLFFKVSTKKDGLEEFPYDFLNQIMKEADLDVNSSREECIRKIVPFLPRIYEGIYEEFGQLCAMNDIQAVWVHLPSLEPEGSVKVPYDRVMGLALDNGFDVLDITEVYNGYDLDSLKLSRNDIHPNAQGHLLIAEALYSKLAEYLTKNNSDTDDRY